MLPWQQPRQGVPGIVQAHVLADKLGLSQSRVLLRFFLSLSRSAYAIRALAEHSLRGRLEYHMRKAF
jgi:hypothetical protein